MPFSRAVHRLTVAAAAVALLLAFSVAFPTQSVVDEWTNVKATQAPALKTVTANGELAFQLE